MERKSAWLVIGGLLLVVFFFFAQHIPIMKGLTVAGHAVAGDTGPMRATAQSGKETESKLPGLENKDVVVTGPLISWMREADREAPKTNTFPTQAPGASDRVAFAPRPKPKNFLHTVFPIKTYAQFAFIVLPHTVSPKLRGNFRSFTRAADSSAGEAADVDVVVLNEQEFNDFLHHRAGTATFELDSSHNQAVDYAVPPTQDEPQKYHLVFRNSATKREGMFVEADFTVYYE